MARSDGEFGKEEYPNIAISLRYAVTRNGSIT